ncbi:MAG TPA: hypothetical protein V6C65_22790 [Allocoleopsis sp.]
MTQHPNHPLVSSFQAQAELELMQLILEEPISYPYNPADPEAEAYFEALEQEVLAMGWSEEDLMAQGAILSHNLDNLWASFSAPIAAPSTLTTDLLQRFAARVPQQLLESIAQKAKQVFNQNLSVADQLVQCVQGSLPTWGAEDLLVFARPLAYTMRAAETEKLDTALRSVRTVEWTELTDIEQARLSLAIARYAISQVAAEEATQD